MTLYQYWRSTYNIIICCAGYGPAEPRAPHGYVRKRKKNELWNFSLFFSSRIYHHSSTWLDRQEANNNEPRVGRSYDKNIRKRLRSSRTLLEDPRLPKDDHDRRRCRRVREPRARETSINNNNTNERVSHVSVCVRVMCTSPTSQRIITSETITNFV